MTSPVFTSRIIEAPALALKWSMPQASSSRTANCARRSIDSCTGFRSACLLISPKLLRACRPVESMYFSMPAMPTPSRFVAPRMWAAATPFG